MRRFVIIFVILLALIALAVPLNPDAASAQSANVPRIHVKAGTSINWSGYAAFNQTGFDSNQDNPILAPDTITYVTGTWKVPAVNPSSGNTYSSAWVGIDGYTSNTVEQIGTEQDVYNGQPVYYAWYEMYPKMSKTIRGFVVQPGDTITASVTYSGGKFILTMTSSYNNQTFTITQKANRQMERSSAEWIMEAPWSGGVLPLANFGAIDFTNCSFSSTSAINQSIPKAQMTDTTMGWVSDRMDMVNASGELKDQTSSLSSQNRDFSISWVSSN